MDVLEKLVQKGANPDVPGMIQEAVKSGDTLAVNKILDSGADINTIDRVSGSLLQIAVANDHEEIVKLLFDRGFDAKAPGCAIGPALTRAIKLKHNGVAKILLQKGSKTGG